MRRILVALTAALTLLVLVPASPASSAPPEPLFIVVDESLPVGTDGLVIDGNTCQDGTVATEPLGDPRGTRVLRFDVLKTFDCGGGDGFVIELSVVLFTETGVTLGNWSLGEGTGEFAGATGNGVLYGTPDAEGIDDTYIGLLR